MNDMKKSVIGMIFILCLSVLNNIPSLSAETSPIHSGDLADVTYGPNTVTIDGTLNTGEWSDANTILLTSGTDSLTIYLKENGTDLFVGYKSNLNFICDIYLDVNNDGGSTPKTDDYRIHASFAVYEMSGTGSGWTNSVSPVGWSSTTGYTTDREFQISYSKIGITAGQEKTLGIAFVVMAQGVTFNWPSTYVRDDPSSWGDISSSDWWTTGAPPPNEPPSISDNKVSPSWGTTDMDYGYSVEYLDNENDEPTISSIFIDDVAFTMTTDDSSYDDGSMFTYNTILSEGEHNYYFLFNDSKNEVRFPETGVFSGPTVVLPNENPTLVPGGIPNGTFFIDEDSGDGNDLIDLSRYFSDDRDDGSLLFEIVFEEDETNLDAEIDNNYLDIEQKHEHWFGTRTFRVKATDRGLDSIQGNTDDASTLSNLFEITVNETNDLPIIESIGPTIVKESGIVEFTGPSSATEDNWINLTITASDADIGSGVDDELNFWVNSTIFSLKKDPLNPFIANLSFLPTNDDIGTYHVLVGVEDRSLNNDTVYLIIEVENSNDDPYIESVDLDGLIIEVEEKSIAFTNTIFAKEEEWFNFSIIAKDIDLDIGETDIIEYFINSTNPNLNLDRETGFVSFLPTQEDVGFHYFNITIRDAYGLEKDDFLNIIIDVRNTNDAPTIPVVTYGSGGEEILEGEYLNATASATDLDIQYDPSESLEYSWISDIDGILGSGNTLQINTLSVGIHNITVRVSDNYGEESTTIFIVIVTMKPVINDTEPVDTDYPEDDDEGGRSLAFTIVIIIAVVLILIGIGIGVGIFLLIRKKQAKDEQDENSEETIPEGSGEEGS